MLMNHLPHSHAVGKPKYCQEIVPGTLYTNHALHVNENGVAWASPVVESTKDGASCAINSSSFVLVRYGEKEIRGTPSYSPAAM